MQHQLKGVTDELTLIKSSYKKVRRQLLIGQTQSLKM